MSLFMNYLLYNIIAVHVLIKIYLKSGTAYHKSDSCTCTYQNMSFFINYLSDMYIYQNIS